MHEDDPWPRWWPRARIVLIGMDSAVVAIGFALMVFPVPPSVRKAFGPVTWAFQASIMIVVVCLVLEALVQFVCVALVPDEEFFAKKARAAAADAPSPHSTNRRTITTILTVSLFLLGAIASFDLTGWLITIGIAIEATVDWLDWWWSRPRYEPPIFARSPA